MFLFANRLVKIYKPPLRAPHMLDEALFDKRAQLIYEIHCFLL